MLRGFELRMRVPWRRKAEAFKAVYILALTPMKTGHVLLKQTSRLVINEH